MLSKVTDFLMPDFKSNLSRLTYVTYSLWMNYTGTE